MFDDLLMDMFAEEKRIAKEQKRLAEEKRLTEEKRLAEENRRKIAEEKRLAEERRIAEEKRLAEERKIAEEKKQIEVALKIVMKQKEAAYLDSIEQHLLTMLKKDPKGIFWERNKYQRISNYIITSNLISKFSEYPSPNYINTLLNKYFLIAEKNMKFSFKENRLNTKSDNAQVKKNSSVKINVLRNDNIGDKTNLLLDVIRNPKLGSVKIENNRIIYHPYTELTGLDTLIYQVDNGLATGSAMVRVYISK